jgi:hypothetical protein
MTIQSAKTISIGSKYLETHIGFNWQGGVRLLIRLGIVPRRRLAHRKKPVLVWDARASKAPEDASSTVPKFCRINDVAIYLLLTLASWAGQFGQRAWSLFVPLVSK